MIYYLLTIVDNLHLVMLLLSVVFGISLFIMTLINLLHIEESIDNVKRRKCYHFDEDSIRRRHYAKLNKISAILFAIFLSLAVLLPTSKGIAFIYVAPKLIENDNVKETFANIPELAKLGTDYLKELLKEKANNDRQRDSNSTDNN